MARARVAAKRPPGLPAVLRSDWFLAVSVAAAVAVFVLGDGLFGRIGTPAGMGAAFVALFAIVLVSAFKVVGHAEVLAHRLGEPYGTLILTLSVVIIEVVSISAVILHGQNNPTLVRDSLLGLAMIILNGMVGVSLLVGGWRHREQHYNLQGATTYLSLIVPLVVLSLVLPSFTKSTEGPTLAGAQSVFLILTSLGLYAAFLMLQAGRHRGYFAEDAEPPRPRGRAATAESPVLHAALLVGYLAAVVLLATQLAKPVDYFTETLGLPEAIGGFALACLVAAPEALGAMRAASDNHLQRSVNIALGSMLSTIGLTIPAMLIIGHLTGRAIILGVDGTDRVMLVTTLAVSVITFSHGRTNVMQGAVHLLLFAAFMLLLVQG